MRSSSTTTGPDKGSLKVPVGSIVHAVSILNFLSETEEGPGVTVIANALGISPSSCFNILKTLVAQEFIEFDPRGKTYSIGLGVVNLARRALNRNNIFPLVRSQLQACADEFGLAAGLWRLTRLDRLVLVGLAETEETTRIHLTIGQRLPMLAGAVGRCVAASSTMSRPDIGKHFKNIRWQKPITLTGYLDQVRAVKDRGWAVDADQYMRGVTTVAAAVTDDTGNVRFCLSGTVFSGRHGPEAITKIGERLRGLAIHAAQSVFGDTAALR